MLEKYIEAGRIFKRVRDELLEELSPQTELLWIAEFVENRIRELGGDIAFPVNLSLDADAAHDTAEPGDRRKIGRSLLKIDIGVMVDGYICDSAFSVSFNPEHRGLINAAKEALKAAVEMARPGVEIGKIGGIIEETIRGFGFKPVENLTGHGVGRFDFHAEPVVPNIRTKDSRTLAEGMAIAIEPFATNGAGRVRNSTRTQIFQFLADRPARSQEERRILEYAKARKVPFSLRELKPNSMTRISIINLLRKGALMDYPVLTEVSGGLVSQAEVTVIVGDEPVVLGME